MNGQWSSKGVTTVPVRNSEKKLSEQQLQPELDRSSSSSGRHCSPAHSASGSPRPSPVHSLSRSVNLPLRHSPVPGSPTGQPRSTQLAGQQQFHSSTRGSPQTSPSGFHTPPPGHSPVVPGRRFQFPPRTPPADQQPKVQVVAPYRCYPEEFSGTGGSSSFRAAYSSLPRSAVAHHHPRTTPPPPPPPEPGSGVDDEVDEDVVEYPHQQMYLGGAGPLAGSRSAAEEQRERQLKRFAAMQNNSQHKQPVSMSTSLYGEFGVPMDFEIPPLDPNLPAEHPVLPAADDIAVHLGSSISSSSTYDLLPPLSDYLPPPAESPVREPHIPTPDYDPDTPTAERNSFVFVEKFKDVISHINTIEELYSEVPEPDPDYQDEDSTEFPPPPPSIAENPEPAEPGGDATPTTPTTTTIIGVRNGAVSSPEDEGGEMIQPKKLVNPCVVSRERQALHKELLMNYKLGKDVLQKPELNKVLAKRKETQKRKEWEEMQTSKRTSLELRLEEQANKLKEKEVSEKMNTIKEDTKAPEFVQMHRRITHKTPTSPPT